MRNPGRSTPQPGPQPFILPGKRKQDAGFHEKPFLPVDGDLRHAEMLAPGRVRIHLDAGEAFGEMPALASLMKGVRLRNGHHGLGEFPLYVEAGLALALMGQVRFVLNLHGLRVREKNHEVLVRRRQERDMVRRVFEQEQGSCFPIFPGEIPERAQGRLQDNPPGVVVDGLGRVADVGHEHSRRFFTFEKGTEALLILPVDLLPAVGAVRAEIDELLLFESERACPVQRLLPAHSDLFLPLDRSIHAPVPGGNDDDEDVVGLVCQVKRASEIPAVIRVGQEYEQLLIGGKILFCKYVWNRRREHVPAHRPER